MQNAELHILNTLWPLVPEFYERTNHERLKTGWVSVSQARSFATFEQLADNLLASNHGPQVVVCHGRGPDGLLVPFATAATTHNATGRVIHDLAMLAKKKAKDQLSATDPQITYVSQRMGTNNTTVTRVVEKLSLLAGRQFLRFPIIAIRGCNIGTEPGMMESYKEALGAWELTAPNCRQLYVRIIPGRPAGTQTMAGLRDTSPGTPRTRRRFFSGDNIDPIIIDIRDIDGHTRVESPRSFMDDPSQVHRWAARLNAKQWRGAENNFILQVLWDDLQDSYFVPRDANYMNRIVHASKAVQAGI